MSYVIVSPFCSLRGDSRWNAKKEKYLVESSGWVIRNSSFWMFWAGLASTISLCVFFPAFWAGVGIAVATLCLSLLLCCRDVIIFRRYYLSLPRVVNGDVAKDLTSLSQRIAKLPSSYFDSFRPLWNDLTLLASSPLVESDPVAAEFKNRFDALESAVNAVESFEYPECETVEQEQSLDSKCVSEEAVLLDRLDSDSIQQVQMLTDAINSVTDNE